MILILRANIWLYLISFLRCPCRENYNWVGIEHILKFDIYRIIIKNAL